MEIRQIQNDSGGIVQETSERPGET